MLGQLFLDLLRVSALFVYFVDRKDHWQISRLSMRYGLLGLWHYRVVRSNNYHGYVGHFGTTGTHRGERFVTWSIQEGDLLAGCSYYTVGTNVLGDTTSLTGHYVRTPYIVEQ